MVQKSVFFFAVLLLTFFSSACSDDDNSSSEPEIPATISFNGISPVDVQGAPVAAPDPTDWKLTDGWTSTEENLFGTEQLALCSPNPDFEVFPAYPNPCMDILSLSLKAVPQYSLDLRLVDSEYTLLFLLNNLALDTISAFQIDLNQAQASSGDTLRLYYRIRGEDCQFQGHGDILFNP
jgi:hypothetical protein